MVYLCGRPLRNRGRCTLGRETAIQKMVWGEDGWLRTLDGQGIPTLETPAPSLPAHAFPAGAGARGFQRAATADRFPMAAHAVAGGNLQPHRAARASCGCLAAKRSAACSGNRWSRGGSSRIASAPPRSSSSSRNISSRAAGLVCYYNSAKFHYLYLSHDETLGKHLRVMSCLPDSPQTDAFTPPHRDSRRQARASARRGGLRAALLRLSRRRRGRRLALAAAAIRREHPLRRSDRARARRISPAHSSAWPARTWPARRCPRILTSSNTGREIIGQVRLASDRRALAECAEVELRNYRADLTAEV